MYAAMDHNDLVDRADITPVGVPECVHHGVLGMGIVTSHRGAGPGPRLLDACLEPAPRCGITKVGLPVFTSNTAAIALYRRADFTDIATIKDYRRLDCVSYDPLMMEKFLA
jgi:ribosomal protein S18 acetylase RimI-like enzyme